MPADRIPPRFPVPIDDRRLPLAPLPIRKPLHLARGPPRRRNVRCRQPGNDAGQGKRTPLAGCFKLSASTTDV